MAQATSLTDHRLAAAICRAINNTADRLDRAHYLPVPPMSRNDNG